MAILTIYIRISNLPSFCIFLECDFTENTVMMSLLWKLKVELMLTEARGNHLYQKQKTSEANLYFWQRCHHVFAAVLANVRTNHKSTGISKKQQKQWVVEL